MEPVLSEPRRGREHAADAAAQRMRTLHLGLRVAHLERSLAFYAALGYEVVGSVPATSLGDLTMIKLPDDPFVTVELVSGSSASASSGGGSLSHLVIKVESVDAVLADLAGAGVRPDQEPASPDASTKSGPLGSPIRTETGSSSCSGRPATRTA